VVSPKLAILYNRLIIYTMGSLKYPGFLMAEMILIRGKSTAILERREDFPST
jgi:hypothetical protein